MARRIAAPKCESQRDAELSACGSIFSIFPRQDTRYLVNDNFGGGIPIFGILQTVDFSISPPGESVTNSRF
jgi:hypothetical protein